MDAGFFDRSYVKVVGIDELHDDYAKEVVVGQGWCLNLGEAAKKRMQFFSGPLDRITRTEEFDHLRMQLLILFIDDGIATVDLA